MQAMIVDITSENFQEMVLQNSHHLPVLVDFWAPWCGPCKQILPQLEQLAQQLAGRFILAKVNTEEQQALADQFQIRSIPSFKVYFQGQVVEESQGALPIGEFKKMLEKYLPADASEEKRLEAQEAFNQGNFDQVIVLLAEAAKLNPNNYRVHIDLVKMYLHTGNIEEAEKLFFKLPEEAQSSPEGNPVKMTLVYGKMAAESGSLEQIQQNLANNPEDLDALYGLVGYLMVNHAYEDAMKSLLKVFMIQRDYQDGIAQKTLVEIFNNLQASHPELVNAYRRKLQSLLF